MVKLTIDQKARLLNIPVVRLFDKRPGYEDLFLIPEDIAFYGKIIVFGSGPDFIKVAAEDPASKEVIDILEGLKKKLKKRIEVFIASPKDIIYGLEWYKDANLSKNKHEKILEEDNSKTERKIKREEKQKKDIRFDSVLDIINHAILMSASKIHLECGDNSAKVFYHVKKLHAIADLSKELGEKLISEIREMASIDENHTYKHGDFCLLKGNKYYHILITSFPMLIGEKFNIEVDEFEEDRYDLSYLGMSQQQIESIKKSFKKSSGIYFITGPEGSGRSSTMYGLLLLLAKRKRNIATLENPIECHIEGVEQIKVNPVLGMTYNSGFKKLMSGNFDTIMTEGVRDSETLKLVFDAAKKGKKIIAPLNAKDIFSVFSNLEDMGISIDDIAKHVNLVVNQRLVLRLCSNCEKQKALIKQSEEEIREELRQLPKLSKTSNIKAREFKPNHCKKCDMTGFWGHTALFEVLEISGKTEEIISKKEYLKKEKDVLNSFGISTLAQDGLVKAQKGITTLSEIERVTK